MNIPQRHARGYYGEQTMAFALGEQGYVFVEGPSGSKGHGVTQSGFDGIAYHPKTGHLIIYDNKAFGRAGDVGSASAVDPARNLTKNLARLLQTVRQIEELPGKQDILAKLEQTASSIRRGQTWPKDVQIAVTNAGGRSTGVTRSLAARGISFIDVNRVPRAPKLRARVGMPDMKPITVGGPSPRGQAVGAAFELLFRGINFVVQLINDRQQQSKLQRDLERLEPQIERDLIADPTLGVLLRFWFLQGAADPESLLTPTHRYGYVTYGRGHTVSEARHHAERHGSLRESPVGGSWIPSEYWFPPSEKVSADQLRRPFPVVATATFLPGHERLQNVKFGSLQGFDDEGCAQLSASNGPTSAYRFHILQPPSSIVFRHGTVIGPMRVPVVQARAGGATGTIPVVDLDTTFGSVKAAMVMAANDFTAAAFTQAPATTMDPPGAIQGHVNFDRLRWIRPEDIKVCTRI